MIRLFDFISSLLGLIILSPVFFIFSFLVWKEDKHNPYYVSMRAGKGGKPFKFIKFRSMRIGADKSGVDSTSSNDSRITDVGRKIRKYKVDELPQLFNVLIGQMSLVGPRPNVKREVDLYTNEEKKLLNIKPGVTSLSSIVFSDEGEILNCHNDPDLAYNQLIRPWKNKLDLFYVSKHSFFNSYLIVFITVIAIFNKLKALSIVNKFLVSNGADIELVNVCLRQEDLQPSPPPGADEIVTSR